MKRIKKIFLCLMLVGFFCVFLSGKALAESVGLGVDNSVIMLRAGDKKDLPFSFNIKNQTNSDQKIHLEQKDISIGDENDINFLDAQSGPSSLVFFQENDFILKAGQSRLIRAAFESVGNEQISNSQTMTLISFSPEENQNKAGSTISGSIGVYVIISGEETQNAAGKIESFSLPKYFRSSVEIKTSYTNIGDLQFVPQGKVVIFNILTREKIEVPLENHFVFPGKKFTFVKTMFNLSPVWIYRLDVIFIDGNKGISEKGGITVGGAFPIVLLFGTIILFYFVVFLIKVRKNKNIN
ncbi:MAG: hypothetical protein HGA61_01695 [Candidatus Moranbacteria bacterium]|nr:hypothetical protein [Candidatus Moranbacteria bacterium]